MARIVNRSQISPNRISRAEAQNRAADRVREREVLLDPSLEPDLDLIAEQHAGIQEAGVF